MANKKLVAILFAGVLGGGDTFAQDDRNTQNAYSQEHDIIRVLNLTKDDYRLLSDEEILNVRGTPNNAVKVYTKKSGLENPEYYIIRNGSRVQMYYPKNSQLNK